MSRVLGFITHENIGRLVAIDGPVIFDSSDLSDKTVRFMVPSGSIKDQVYNIEVALRTGEIDCPCKRHKPFRETRTSPVRFGTAASYAEALAVRKGMRLAPMLCRAPKGLCRHGRLVRSWFKRHKLWHLIESAERFVIERLEREPDVRKSA